MADRIGVISKGELIVVEDKAALMRKLGKKQLTLQLQKPLARIPEELAAYPLELSADGHSAGLHVRRTDARPASHRCSSASASCGIDFKDLHTSESSLEDIFVSLVQVQRHEYLRPSGRSTASRWRAPSAR